MATGPARVGARQHAARAARAALEAVGVRRLQVGASDTERFVQLCAALHRLDRELSWLRRCDRRTPALYHRLSSVTMAYDAVLRETGQVVGVPVPEGLPLDPVSRLEVEAALTAAGVSW
jgi:hypothetical protein